MKPEIKRLLLLFSVLAAVVFIGLVTAFRSAAFDSFLKQKLINAVAPDLRLTIGNFSLFGTTLEMEGVDAYIPRRLAGLAFDRVRLQPSIWSLLRGTLDLRLLLAAYGGTVNLQLIADRSGQIKLPELDIRNLDLERHPQISGAGIESGMLDLQGRELLLGPGLQSGEIELNLRKVTLARDSILFHQLRIPGTLVPQIENGSIVGPIKIAPQRVQSADLQVSLGFAAFRGSASAALDGSGKVREFDVAGVVSLEAIGVEQIGPFLPALSGGKLEASANRFKISGSGSPKSPRWKFERAK